MNTFSASIPAESLPEVRAHVAKFNKRAARKGMPQVALVVGPERRYEVQTAANVSEVRFDHECSLTVPPLTIGSYVLVGRVEPLTTGGKVEPFVTTAPGQFVPEQYGLDDPFRCEHCNAVRRRSETFLVRSIETGDLVQVGRQCIRDFLGHDPAALLSYWRDLDRLGSDDEDGLGGYGGRYVAPQYKSDDILRLTARVVAALGWLSKSKAGDYETPTGTHVHYLLDGPHGSEAERREWEKFNAKCEWTDRAEDIYNQTIDALGALGAKEARVGFLGDWEENVLRLWRADFVPPQRVGYLCSAVVMGWKRVNAPRSEKSLQEPLSRPNVAEGDKVTVTGTVVFTTITDGQWGATTLVKVETSEPRRQYVWWASGALTFEPQQVITLKGTVKRVGYDDYAKGEVATLTRCKVI